MQTANITAESYDWPYCSKTACLSSWILGHFLYFSIPLVKVEEKLDQDESDQIAQGKKRIEVIPCTDPSPLNLRPVVNWVWLQKPCFTIHSKRSEHGAARAPVFHESLP